MRVPVDRIVLGAVIPVTIYYVGRKMDLALEGAIIASVWCLLLMGFSSSGAGSLTGIQP